MCSWCWGFTPVLEVLRGHYHKQRWKLVVGGLRPGANADRVDAAMKAYLREHWDAVEQRTGQLFDHSFFDRDDFVYDTEPACRAVVVLNSLDAEKNWSFFHALQEAFYAKGLDITKSEILAYLAGEWLDEVSVFTGRMTEEAWRVKTYAQFQESRDLGVSSFPSLLVKKDHFVMPVSVGYRSVEEIIPKLDEALVALS